MRVVSSISDLRKTIKSYKNNNETVGFVPTMGNLHAGHLDLVSKAASVSSHTVVSIFVNPTQFERLDDLDAYPRTMESDLAQLEQLGVDLVFFPEPIEMYPHGGLVTEVDVPKISSMHEGRSRPGHFRGVATVVCKLFNIVMPDVAIFGQKDFQQLSLIRQMVADLNMPIEIIGAPTIREPDGLAMSSRNTRLSLEERLIAPNLYRILKELENKVTHGDCDYLESQNAALEALSKLGFKPDYILVCDAQTLQVAKQGDNELVILAAAYLGEVRLIDNLQVSLA
jgi:pantoate--beta-alanine ligase